MIPHYEHLLIIAILENNSDKVKKIARTNNLNVNYFSVLDGWRWYFDFVFFQIKFIDSKFVFLVL